MPVVVDQSTPEPKTSLTKTISVASSARRQSFFIKARPAKRSSAIRRPSSSKSVTLLNPIATAIASVHRAGPPHSRRPRRRSSRSSSVRSIFPPRAIAITFTLQRVIPTLRSPHVRELRLKTSQSCQRQAKRFSRLLPSHEYPCMPVGSRSGCKVPLHSEFEGVPGGDCAQECAVAC
jgi:hypothetical protein